MAVSNYAYQLMDMLTQYQTPAIIMAAQKLGVIQALGSGSATLPELAQRLNMPQRSLGILLRACVALELLGFKDDRFSNGVMAQSVLVPGAPGYIGRLVDKEAFFYRAWAGLEECVRFDTAALAPIRDRARENPETTRMFLTALDDIAKLYAGDMAPCLDLSGCNRLLDVGGGVGTFACALAKRYPKLDVTILELPEVIPWAEAYVAESGMSGRIDLMAGDFMSDEFPAGYDSILFSNIFHDNPTTINQGLLVKAFRALKEGDRVIIYDFLLEPNRITPAGSAIFAVMMLVENPGGNVYTGEQYESWLGGAGFKETSVIRMPDPSPMGLIIGSR
ncbi:MAG: methyltransferase [Anaerolineales bacterium]|nr:methyltransferase [Anaerolineales bacterium]